MRIVAISDTHNKQEQLTLPAGDLLIIAGDLTGAGTIKEVAKYGQWLAREVKKYTYGAVVGAGNHDFLFEEAPMIAEQLLNPENNPQIRYLQNTFVVINGFKIYVSADTNFFHNWAFNLMPAEMEISVQRIPPDTDILVTHGPPLTVLDRCQNGKYIGSEELLSKVKEIKPLFHIFGHNHNQGGCFFHSDDTIFVNASMLNEYYQPNDYILDGHVTAFEVL